MFEQEQVNRVLKLVASLTLTNSQNLAQMCKSTKLQRFIEGGLLYLFPQKMRFNFRLLDEIYFLGKSNSRQGSF